jgi:hypothetical protein
MYDYLSVYKINNYNKIRLGKKNDGGYVIYDIPDVKYDIFISGGIELDISFEEDFVNKYPDVPCIAFDGTIDSLPVTNSNKITFIKKNLGNINTDEICNLKEYFDKYNSIFMKMDIEGGEISLFQAISDDDLKKIKQIVIEFHSAYERDIPIRLSKTHWLSHFHPNNCCGLNSNGVPNVFECTYVLKTDDINVEINNLPIPDPSIDHPNVPHFSDICLSGYPYTTSTI